MNAEKIRRVSTPACCVVLACALGAAVVSLSRLISRQALVTVPEAVYYLPSARYIRMTTGSFRPFFANLICIKGVLELTDPVPDRQSYLLKVFRAAIELDPRLLSAYFMGGMVVPAGREDLGAAIAFLEDVSQYNRRDWQIPYWTGFNYYQLGQYEKAARYYQQAAALPGAPRYLVTNQAMLYYRADKPEGALLYLEGLLDTIKDQRALELIKIKVAWLKNIVILDTKVREYRAMTGAWPDTLDDLVSRGLLAGIPEDPFGRGYYLEKQGPDAQARVRSRF